MAAPEVAEQISAEGVEAGLSKAGFVFISGRKCETFRQRMDGRERNEYNKGKGCLRCGIADRKYHMGDGVIRKTFAVK